MCLWLEEYVSIFSQRFLLVFHTVPLKSKLPVVSCFRRDAIRVVRESSKRKMSGIN